MANLSEVLTPSRRHPQAAALGILQRVYGFNNAPVVQSDLSAMHVKVTDTSTGTATYTATVTISTAFFNTLQTDSKWTVDAVGYNLIYYFPGTAFPNGAARYEVLFYGTDSAGRAIAWPFYVNTIATWE